jgi:mono/diheme cytochrome c family protein
MSSRKSPSRSPEARGPGRLAAGAAGVALALAVPALADESALRLKDGPEAVTVRAYCSSCHSVDYIQMNSAFMKKAGWEAEVRKMIKVMGAPVPDAEFARIVDYLTANYGVE